MQACTNSVVNTSIGAIPNASIAVFHLDGTPATISATNHGPALASNTVNTDAFGNFSFYAANGHYKLVVTIGIVTITIPDVSLYDPDDDTGRVQPGNLAAPGGAATVGFAPTGGLASTTVQAALAELDGEKARSDTLAASSGATTVGYGTDTVAGALDKANARTITANTTYVVAPSGGNYTSVQACLAFLADKVIADGVTVTIQVNDGTYNSTTPIYLTGAFAKAIQIVAQNTYNRNVMSIQSSSGSAGAWSLVLNMDSVANVAAGDYVILHTASGGTNPTYVAGCHKITAVDAVNSRITVLSLHQAATAPSGAVVATAQIMKSIISFSGGCDGMDVWGGGTAVGMSGMVLVCADGLSNGGLSIQDGGRLFMYGSIGVVGFKLNTYVLYCSHITGVPNAVLACSGGQTNFAIKDNSALSGVKCIGSGATLNDGFTVDACSVLDSSTTLFWTATGNKRDGFRGSNVSTMLLYGSKATGNLGYGWNNTDATCTGLPAASATGGGNTLGDNNTAMVSVVSGMQFNGPVPVGPAQYRVFSYEAPYTRYYIGPGNYMVFSNRNGGVTNDWVYITDTGLMRVQGAFGRGIAFVTAGAAYTVAIGDTHLKVDFAGTVTMTLPSASQLAGRELIIRTVQNQAVVSASANVVPMAGGAATTAILPATAGKWVCLVSDGANWQIQMGN